MTIELRCKLFAEVTQKSTDRDGSVPHSSLPAKIRMASDDQMLRKVLAPVAKLSHFLNCNHVITLCVY